MAVARRAPVLGGSRRLGTGRRVPWGRIALAALLAVVVVGLVPPLRRAAAVVTSKALLFAFSPIAPGIGNFDDLFQGSKVLAADGSVLAVLDGAQRREPVALDTLPEHVPRAVLAAEDANFYDHGGVDPSAVFRAFLRNAQGSRQGGSTITQQLAKLNYTKSERTVLRKLREVQYAVRLEKKYSKDELLERYLNQVYFGEGAYGLAAAANVFFGVPPEQLTPAQAATLAGKIKAPGALDPRRNPEDVVQRRDQVLRNMARRGWLTPTQHDEARATPLQVVPEMAPAGRAPHFVEYVKREAAGLDELGGSPESRTKQLFTGGYTIKTTLDPKAFDAATQAVTTTLDEPGDPDTAVASVAPGDGAIRVLFGGRDFAARKFDLASQGRRQAGSSFKPYVYLAAVHDGIDPSSTFDASSPKELEYRGERYTVDNYEGEGAGTSTIDNAMTHSINTVFAQLILEVGPEDVTRVAEELGIADVAENVGSRPAIALGGLRKGVTPLEQAAAFAAFAAKGVYAEPYAISTITDRQGRQIYGHEPETRQAFDAKEVGVLNNALLSVVREGTGTAARIDRPAAGKTGTTQNHGDAWFVGFVPQLATAVWVGHAEGIVPMTDVHGRRVTGGSFPAQIWGKTMRAALEGLPREDVFTASPSAIGLRRLDQAPPSSSSTTTSSTSFTTTPSTLLPLPTTPTTFRLLPGATTTTTMWRSATTTTTKRSATTTTTSRPTTTSSPSTTTSSSSTTTSSTTTTTTGRS